MLMKQKYLLACALSTITMFFNGCSHKKNLPTAVLNEQKNPPQNTQPPTNASKEPKAVSQPPIAPNQSFDITTQKGFLGKSVNPQEEIKKTMEHASKNFARNASEFNQYKDLTFFVQNVSGSTLFVANFAYIKPRRFNRWRWRKSAVQEIKSQEKISMSIRTLDDYKDSKEIFGALGVFPNKPEAETATYELMKDENKLDLDSITALAGKTVIIGVERYGLRQPFYDYDFVENNEYTKKNASGGEQELDFFVQNKTGRPVFITGFIYSKKAKGKWTASEDDKDDMSVWRFYKTKVLRLENNQTGYVDVDTIIPKRDRNYVRGYLGVFDENHEEEAHNKTFELLSDQEKITIGSLNRRHGSTIILEVERYGVSNDVIDFTVKPIRWIDFTKIVH